MSRAVESFGLVPCVRTRALLELAIEDEDELIFDLGDPDVDPLEVCLSRRRWDDFGQPKVLTVTVEPGDTHPGPTDNSPKGTLSANARSGELS